MKKIIRIIMIILTLVYPLFMNFLAGTGLIYNKDSYGVKMVIIGILMIISGISMTSGTFLCLSSKKATNIISLTCSVSGLILCLAMLYLLCSHADNAGWVENYTMNPVSDMYRTRILPVIIPSALSTGISILHIKQNRTS